VTAARVGKRCPICGKPAKTEHRPFCSRRCADIDLNRWLSGAYAIPAAEESPGSNDRDEEDGQPSERN
jgi:uncharacterized protein